MILYYRTTNERICAAGFVRFAADLQTIPVPADFDLDTATDYRVVNGVMIYDPVKPDPDPVNPFDEMTYRLDIIDGAIAELAAIVGGV